MSIEMISPTLPRPAPRLVFLITVATLLAAAPFQPAWAQTAPSLGAAQSFAVLGGSTVTNTGPTTIRGDLGVSPGSAVTGFPPGLLLPPGTIHAADAVSSGAQADLTNAYLDLESQPCTRMFLSTDDLGCRTLTAGVNCFSSSAQLTGTLTLDGGGNSNAVFIFRIGSTLTTASSANVRLIGGAQACNVFFQVGSSATLGTATSFIGNILALTSITLKTGATINGRALARNGAVTLDTNNVFFSACTAVACTDTRPPTVSVTGMNPGVDGHTQVFLTVQDTGCGLASIVAIVATNTTVVIPPFVPGTTSLVVVTATKITPGSSSVVGLKATDVNGNVTIFDPVDFTITAAHAVTVSVPREEHVVTIINDGLQFLMIRAPGRPLRMIQLEPATTRTINIRAIVRGEVSTLTFEAVGSGSAVVMVHPK